MPPTKHDTPASLFTARSRSPQDQTTDFAAAEAAEEMTTVEAEVAEQIRFVAVAVVVAVAVGPH